MLFTQETAYQQYQNVLKLKGNKLIVRPKTQSESSKYVMSAVFGCLRHSMHIHDQI